MPLTLRVISMTAFLANPMLKWVWNGYKHWSQSWCSHILNSTASSPFD